MSESQFPSNYMARIMALKNAVIAMYKKEGMPYDNDIGWDEIISYLVSDKHQYT
mgnify:CR=1 FL=1